MVEVGEGSLPNVECTASIVTYGTSADDLTLTAEGSATAYTQISYPYAGELRSAKPVCSSTSGVNRS